jgi:hypothetical protein
MWRKSDEKDEEQNEKPTAPKLDNASNADSTNLIIEAPFRTHAGLGEQIPRIRPNNFSNSSNNYQQRAEGWGRGASNQPSQAGNFGMPRESSQNSGGTWNARYANSQAVNRPTYQQQGSQHRFGESYFNQDDFQRGFKDQTGSDNQNNNKAYRPPQLRSQPAENSGAATSPFHAEENQRQFASTDVTNFWNRLNKTVRNLNMVIFFLILLYKIKFRFNFRFACLEGFGLFSQEKFLLCKI